MKNNKLGLKVMAALLALAIVGSFAITTNSNNLRAMEGDEGFVEEAPAEVVQEVFVEPEPEIIPEEPAEEVPVEEPAEQPAEEAPEEPISEEPAEEVPEEPAEEEEAEEEEDKFDVEGAFATIRFMDEDSARAYLASLSGEDRAELKAYIAGLNIGDDEKTKLLSWFEPKQEIQPEPVEEPEEEIEVAPPDVNISFENLDGGKVKSGCHIRIHANVSNVSDGMKLNYRWQYDAGNGWVDAEGGDGEYYDYVITKDNSNYAWHVIVGWTME